VTALAGLVLTSAALAGCSAGSESSTDSSAALVWGRADPITTWEGDRCVTSVPTNLMVFDSLLRIGADGVSIEPGLAESYTYDEATTTYNFVIRDDAMFSNGDPVTAADVVFSIDTWKAGELSGVYYDYVDSATAVDDKTVAVVMRQPDTFLPALLTWCTSNIYPSDFAGMDSTAFFADPIGAGPFKVEATADLGGANENITLVPNQNYWGDDLQLDGLDIMTISDSNQRVLRFQSGEIDVLEGLGEAEMQQLDAAQLVRTSPQVWRGIELNLRSDALDDREVRAAIAAAIDKASIVATLGEGAEIAKGTLPTNLPDFAPPSDPIEYDPEAAQRVLAAAAIGRPLVYLYNPADTVDTNIANVVQSELSNVGVEIVLQGVDAATFRTIGDGSIQWDLAAATASGISPSIFDPASLMLADHYPKTGSDISVLARELARGMASNDPAERTAAVAAIQDDSVAQAALIGIADLPHVYAVSPSVSGFAPLPEQIWYPDGVTLD
jgi:ABC-type transport system substrate-binding protein